MTTISIKRWKKYLKENFGINKPSDLLIECLRDPSKIEDDGVFEEFIKEYEPIYILERGILDGDNEFRNVFFIIDLEISLRGYDKIILEKELKAMEKDKTISIPREYVYKYLLKSQ